MVETGVNATGGHIWFLLGALGFAAICALILSDRWHSLSPVKVKIAAGLAALSGCAHIAAARVGSETFQLSWLFGGVGLVLAVGWYVLSARLSASQRRGLILTTALPPRESPPPKGSLQPKGSPRPKELKLAPYSASASALAPASAPAPRLLSQNTQRSLAAASTALAFASALAVYMSRIV